MAKRKSDQDQDQRLPGGISSFSVTGFKSHFEENRVELAPLTILSGANSSGKSSILQPLLLMKQTLEVGFDPGTLLLDGPHVKFTSIGQFISSSQYGKSEKKFLVSIETPAGVTQTITFSSIDDRSLIVESALVRMGYGKHTSELLLRTDLESDDILRRLRGFAPDIVDRWYVPPDGYRLAVKQERCLLELIFASKEEDDNTYLIRPSFSMFPNNALRSMIHVPGIRGNPERTYAKTSSGQQFFGTFEKYVASIISDWQEKQDARLQQLSRMLNVLGLTWTVSTVSKDDTSVELRVGRLPQGGYDDNELVNIADVGFGVSQVLPVLVAVLVADENQLVFIEQPELHLHPKAQYALAGFLADSAKRGARLVVETHSALLLLHIRTLIANGFVDPEVVRLHWFSRIPEDGRTVVSSGEMDKSGAFGDWPEDFGEVELMAEDQYLRAVEDQYSGDE